MRLGAGMVSRGEVGLIVATLGLTDGLIGAEIFAATVAMIIFTTLVTPPMLRVLFARPNPQRAFRTADPSDESFSEGEPS
ncbi:MAG: cation:proton antiporter [Chloroflexota bacterium]